MILRDRWLLWLRTFLRSGGIAGLILIVAGWFAVAFVSSIEHEKAVEGAIKQSDSLVRLFAQSTIDIIDRVDRTLLLLRRSFEDDPAHFDLHKWAGQAALVGEETLQIGMIDATGYQRATTLDYSGAPVYVGDRKHFQEQLRATDDHLVISTPVIGRTSGRLSLQFSRRLRAADGSFAGLMLISIDPNFISRFYRTVDLGAHGSINVRNSDGVILAAQGFSENVIGREIGRQQPLVEARMLDPSGHYWGGGAIDGINRLVSYRVSGKFPLIFVVGLTEADILNEYRQHRAAYFVVGSIMTLAILIAIAFAFRYQRRLDRSQDDLKRLNAEISRQNLRFDAALTNMSSGLAMFDADGRLAVWNERYNAIYQMPPHLVRHGASIYAIIEYCNQAGDMNLDVVAYVDRLRRELAETGRSRTKAFLRDGRVVSIVNTAIAGGGWVGMHEDVTTQRAQTKLVAEKATELELINGRFNAALHHMSHGVCLFDPQQRVIIANARYAEIYRLRDDQIVPGTSLRQIIRAREENGTNFATDTDAYVSVNVKLASETQKLADGRIVAIKRQPLANGGWLTMHEDVTAEKEAEKLLGEKAAELEVMNKRFSTALSNMAQGLCMFDSEKRLIVWNDRFAQLYRVPPDLLKVGTPYQELVTDRLSRMLKKPYDHPEVKARAAELAALAPDASRVDEMPDGRYMLLTRQPMEDGGWVAIAEDITERRRAEAEIVHLARHDALTGLANRAEFNTRLDQASKRLKRNGHAFAVMMVDLDKFKAVNDTLGHPAGDDLLAEVGRRLKSATRDTDLIARLGGDEFAIIQEGSANQREGAIALALRITDAISRPFDLSGHEAGVGASIGIALAPEDGTEPEELLKRADLALYSVKSSGRNDFRLFRSEMLDVVSNQQSAERELRDAIALNQFELHYQPVVCAKARRLCGVETLVRWRHPVRGMIPPDHFIPLAESTGLIGPLGEWILERACKDAASWPAHINVAVNISAVQFKKGNLFDVILSTLVKTGLAPERLELEITETSLLEDQEAHLTTIRQLKNLGLALALDDFGTGFSSMTYLTVFPFDKIKIDKSFTRGVLDRTDCKAVVASMLALAQGLGIVTTAEGVETEEQFEYMRAAGVDLVQGYLIGKPVPLTDFGRPDATILTALVA